MGPFETIELNAPGGIPDYCQRYGASIMETASQQTGNTDPFGAATVAKIMAEWPYPQNAERVAKLSVWRDNRLAALKAHKQGATKKPKI